MSGVILVDFDGTLAVHNVHQPGLDNNPDPVPEMVERVKTWLMHGFEVKIFTARASVPELIPPIQEWSKKHLGVVLEVTNQKDFRTIEIWDDRAIRIEFNTGKII